MPVVHPHTAWAACVCGRCKYTEGSDLEIRNSIGIQFRWWEVVNCMTQTRYNHHHTPQLTLCQTYVCVCPASRALTLNLYPLLCHSIIVPLPWFSWLLHWNEKRSEVLADWCVGHAQIEIQVNGDAYVNFTLALWKTVDQTTPSHYCNDVHGTCDVNVLGLWPLTVSNQLQSDVGASRCWWDTDKAESVCLLLVSSKIQSSRH